MPIAYLDVPPGIGGNAKKTLFYTSQSRESWVPDR